MVILIDGVHTCVSKLYFVNGSSVSHGIGKQKKKTNKKTSIGFHKHILLAYNAVLSCAVTNYLEEINKSVWIKNSVTVNQLE